MSQFDVAAGITQQAINSVISFLFNNTAAKAKIFSHHTTQTLGEFGSVDLDVVINELPTIKLEAPTEADWTASIKPEGATRPLLNGIQFLISSATITMKIAGVTTNATGPVSVFGALATDNPASPYLKVNAVLLDEKDFSDADQDVVNDMLVPELLNLINNLLKSITIPAIPEFEGVELQAIIVRIINGAIVLATSLKTSVATSLDGYVIPTTITTGVYTEINSAIPNVLLNTEVKGKSYGAEDKDGPDEWSAGYKISITVADLSLDLSDAKITAKLTPDSISAKGEVTGLGIGITKAVLCPVTTAIDAMIDPDNWDKITASFSVSIAPKEASVVAEAKVVTVKNKAGKDVQKARLSVTSTGDLQVFVLPKWSGTISGTVLATAASVLVDMIDKAVTSVLVETIIKGTVKNLDVYEIPKISHQIEGVTVSIAIPDTDIKVSANKTIVQELKITAV